MPGTLVVTGASGNVGKPLALDLLARGRKVRVIGRDLGRLAGLAERGAETRVGDLADHAFLASAFAGAAGAFLMIPPSYSATDFRAYQRSFVDSFSEALTRAGVGRAATLSSIGAELEEGTGPIAGLHDLEQRLDRLPGLDVVHLRAAYFFENHLGSIATLRQAGVFGGTVDPGVAIPMVATRDIAAVAAEALAGPRSEESRVRYVLGPRDLTFTEVARILGAAVGKPDLPYLRFPEAEAKAALLAAGLSEDVAERFLEMNRGLSSGLIRPAQPRDERSATPTGLERFARDVFAPAYAAAEG